MRGLESGIPVGSHACTIGTEQPSRVEHIASMAYAAAGRPSGPLDLNDLRLINIHHALHSPSEEILTTLLSILCSDGWLWKLGSCFEDQLDARPFSTTHYNPTWFDTKGAMCVAYGIATKDRAKALESAGIQHLKHTLHIGVNVKDTDDVPHDAICAARPQALYIVPALSTITTQAQFRAEPGPSISRSTSSRSSACRLLGRLRCSSARRLACRSRVLMLLHVPTIVPLALTMAASSQRSMSAWMTTTL